MNVMTINCSCFLGIMSSSNSSKSLTADESSLGILQLDGLPGKMRFAREQNDHLTKKIGVWLVLSALKFYPVFILGIKSVLHDNN